MIYTGKCGEADTRNLGFKKKFNMIDCSSMTDEGNETKQYWMPLKRCKTCIYSFRRVINKNCTGISILGYYNAFGKFTGVWQRAYNYKKYL